MSSFYLRLSQRYTLSTIYASEKQDKYCTDDSNTFNWSSQVLCKLNSFVAFTFVFILANANLYICLYAFQIN